MRHQCCFLSAYTFAQKPTPSGCYLWNLSKLTSICLIMNARSHSKFNQILLKSNKSQWTRKDKRDNGYGFWPKATPSCLRFVFHFFRVTKMAITRAISIFVEKYCHYDANSKELSVEAVHKTSINVTMTQMGHTHTYSSNPNPNPWAQTFRSSLPETQLKWQLKL